jgi:hypothetical protein
VGGEVQGQGRSGSRVRKRMNRSWSTVASRENNVESYGDNFDDWAMKLWLESMMTARGRVGRRDIPNRLVGWDGVQERQSSKVVKSLIKIV